jgi:DNA (cytosine-5)-methyltransferase 1
VFVVASARDDIDPAEILFEREGMRRNTPPSRQTGENVAAGTGAGTEGSFDCGVEMSGPLQARDYKDVGTDGMNKNSAKLVPVSVSSVAPTLTKEGTGVVRPGFQEDGWYVAVAGSLDTQCGGGKLTHQSVANGHLVAARMVAFGEYVDDGTASTMKSRDWKDATDLVAQPIPLDMMNIKGRPSDDNRANRIGRGYGEAGDPMFTITKANHHGVAQPIMIHGTQDPIVSDIAFPQGRNNGQENVLVQAIALAENTIGRKPENGGNGDGFIEGGPMYTLNATGVHGVAIGTDCYNGTITGDISMTLRGGEGVDPTVQPTVMQPITQFGEIAGTLSARHDSSPCADRGQNVINQSMAVRRLTPRECERLQGFPDDYTAIPGASDGPRYKALGNSMAVPVMAWIGKRIAK